MVTDEEFNALKRKVGELEEKVNRELLRRQESPIIDEGLEERIQKFAKDVGISVENLRKVFDFGETNLSLIAIIDGKGEEEKQLKAALCILTAYHYFLSRDDIVAENLRDKIKNLGIKSLTNLSTYLRRYPNFIICNVRSGSNTSTYKITYPGIKRGLELIKELSGV